MATGLTTHLEWLFFIQHDSLRVGWSSLPGQMGEIYHSRDICHFSSFAKELAKWTAKEAACFQPWPLWIKWPQAMQGHWTYFHSAERVPRSASTGHKMRTREETAGLSTQISCAMSTISVWGTLFSFLPVLLYITAETVALHTWVQFSSEWGIPTWRTPALWTRVTLERWRHRKL